MPLNLNLQSDLNINNSRASIFTWVSTRGRYLLLILNIILFCVYVYRFYLDRDNSIRINKIENLVVSLSSYENKALTYDLIQDQADFVKNRNSQNVDEVFVLSIIKNSVPTNIDITGIEVNGRELIIKAKSSDPITFSSFISLIISEERITNLILQSSNYIEKDDSYEVTLVINYS